MSKVVLYRKYRPQKFEEVVGQDHIVKVLQNAAENKRISHAYLFSGPRGTGKTTVARIFAKAINCVENKNIPCNKCEICKEFSSGHTLDLVEIDAASNRGIDEIRNLREAVGLMPLNSPYKVYIIDEVHMMTKEAFNAFLKTLEEPPAHAIFIMATTEPEKVPETITSRTQHFSFKAIPEELIRNSLQAVAKQEKIKIDNEALGLLAFFADGALRDGLNLLDQANSLEAGDITSDEVRVLFGAPSRELIRQAIKAIEEKKADEALLVSKTALEQGIDSKIFIKMLLRVFRAMFLLKLQPQFGGDFKKLFGEEYGFIEKQKDMMDADYLEFILKTLLETANTRFYGHRPELPLELALVKIINYSVKEKASN